MYDARRKKPRICEKFRITQRSRDDTITAITARQYQKPIPSLDGEGITARAD